ncbi:RloB family protein [Cellulomonas bogoriensis]|uniref:RloB family protein n=1 Tax=Cellulomonas bogoriensis TaxID=301388 RepID=UPI0012EB0604|nr:RloB family protein [Cellulomonas bogoriensis]
MTEGMKTEPQYVELLNAFLRSKGATAVVKRVGVGGDPLKVVRRCIDLRDQARGEERFDACVCLVDVDQHAALPAACELADRESVLLLVSNLKFEVWLRWHAEAKRSGLTSSQLDRLTQKLGLIKNKRLPPTFPIHQVHTACQIARQADPGLRAGRVGPDPSSAMPVLVDLLLGR